MEDVSTIVFGVWFLVGAALVFWMQAGFAMVEAGFTRAKNAGNIIMKNLMDFCLGTVSFMILGSSLLIGSSDWALGGFIGKPSLDLFLHFDNYDWSSFVFNLVFCATAATIVSGAMAERTKFSAYCIYSAIISLLIYLGRWLALRNRFPRFRRFMCHPHGRWYISPDRSSISRTSYWKVQEG